MLRPYSRPISATDTLLLTNLDQAPALCPPTYIHFYPSSFSRQSMPTGITLWNITFRPNPARRHLTARLCRPSPAKWSAQSPSSAKNGARKDNQLIEARFISDASGSLFGQQGRLPNAPAAAKLASGRAKVVVAKGCCRRYYGICSS